MGRALITGIRWVSELIGIAGGDDIFPERAACALGKDRILGEADEVIRRAPDIMLGSWCGKRFRPGASRGSRRLGGDARRARRRAARDQVTAHSAAGTGGAHRRTRCHSPSITAMVDAPLTTAPVPSPCIDVCRLDAQGLCVGCRRTMREISEWPNANDARRREILSALKERRL